MKGNGEKSRGLFDSKTKDTTSWFIANIEKVLVDEGRALVKLIIRKNQRRRYDLMTTSLYLKPEQITLKYSWTYKTPKK